ncbi:MAG: hypothetical protein JRF70_14600 [Deltaproteobacteria bacterium]|nr:hypothetical protein [Deltaproteobacteria bacterium]
MPDLPASGRSHLRARRWDVLVLGGALPGLVTAARLCLAGHRVLVIEEEAAAQTFEPLREPFLLTGAVGPGLLAGVLRDLGVPLIELRRLEQSPLAFQVVTPEARIDVGSPTRTAEELVAWGLAKPDTAQPLLRALVRAAAAEHDAMLTAPVVRAGGFRRLGRSAAAPPSRHARGMPAEAASAPLELVPFFDAQVRALSNLAEADPGPEARARLLGAALEGGATFPSTETTLRGLLRARIRALHGEFKSMPGGFELVSADAEPGVAPARSTDLWLGRALVINVPRGLLARALREAEAPVPELVDVAEPGVRRARVHLRTRRSVIPEGMARRIIRVDGKRVITISAYPASSNSDVVEVVASAVGASGDEIERAVLELMPFCEGRLVRHPTPEPRWDDDDALEDPSHNAAWPGEVEIRLASRPRVYQLPRAGLAGLGVEGDVLLGWRAAERIAADLG